MGAERTMSAKKPSKTKLIFSEARMDWTSWAQPQFQQIEDERDRLLTAIEYIVDIGIYPKEFHGGENSYTERTPYMEGWNDACRQMLENWKEASKPGFEIKENED
jgi:hypothetical protein